MADTLVIQPLPGIGDMVWHIPYIEAIAAREPGGRVDVMTKRRSLADELLYAHACVDRVLWLERGAHGHGRHGGVLGAWRLARMLARYRYRRVWVLHHSPRYAMAARLAGIPERYGYGLGWQRLWLNDVVHLGVKMRRAHPIDLAETYLERKGLAVANARPRLVCDPAALEQAQARISLLPRPRLALGIGTSEEKRQWGAQNFRRLMELYLATSAGSVILMGGAQDTAMGENLAAGLDRARVMTCMGEPLRMVNALLSRCDAFFGNDTGLLNIAAALNVPAWVAIGLPISERIARPERGIFALRPPSGMPNDESGLRAIEPERVLRALEVILANR